MPIKPSGSGVLLQMLENTNILVVRVFAGDITTSLCQKYSAA